MKWKHTTWIIISLLLPRRIRSVFGFSFFPFRFSYFLPGIWSILLTFKGAHFICTHMLFNGLVCHELNYAIYQYPLHMCYKKYSQSNRKLAILIQVQALSVHTTGVSSSIVPIDKHEFKTTSISIFRPPSP